MALEDFQAQQDTSVPEVFLARLELTDPKVTRVTEVYLVPLATSEQLDQEAFQGQGVSPVLLAGLVPSAILALRALVGQLVPEASLAPRATPDNRVIKVRFLFHRILCIHASSNQLLQAFQAKSALMAQSALMVHADISAFPAMSAPWVMPASPANLASLDLVASQDQQVLEAQSVLLARPVIGALSELVASGVLLDPLVISALRETSVLVAFQVPWAPLAELAPSVPLVVPVLVVQLALAVSTALPVIPALPENRA